MSEFEKPSEEIKSKKPKHPTREQRLAKERERYPLLGLLEDGEINTNVTNTVHKLARIMHVMTPDELIGCNIDDLVNQSYRSSLSYRPKGETILSLLRERAVQRLAQTQESSTEVI